MHAFHSLYNVLTVMILVNNDGMLAAEKSFKYI